MMKSHHNYPVRQGNEGSIIRFSLAHSILLVVAFCLIVGQALSQHAMMSDQKTTATCSSPGTAINTTGDCPDPSAILDVSSNIQGALIPRMTRVQREAISNPATGLLVYQTDGAAGIYVNVGSAVSPAWIVIGAFAGNPSFHDFFNTAIGLGALNSNTTGPENTAVGTEALFANNTGLGNTACGWKALRYNTSGDVNTAIGEGALNENTIGSANTAAGEFALGSNTSGNSNTAIGREALNHNITGSDNTACGSHALAYNANGSSNTATGVNALFNNLDGYANTASGDGALYRNDHGYQNTATGYQAMRENTSGSLNTASGYMAMNGNTTGSLNTAYGERALLDNSQGFQNTAFGGSALQNNLTGAFNTAIGYSALDISNSSYNTACGEFALGNTTSGDRNTAIGYGALLNNHTGANLTSLGTGTDVMLDGLINSTAIGHAARVCASNTMVFGDTNVIGWGFGVCPSLGHAMDFGAKGNHAYLTSGGVWTNASDRNKKENFTAIDGYELLQKVAELSITKWNYKGEDITVKHIGPVAQDFWRIFGVGNDSTSISTIDPAGIALAAIQVLQKRIEELTAENYRLREAKSEMDGRIAHLEQVMAKVSLSPSTFNAISNK